MARAAIRVLLVLGCVLGTVLAHSSGNRAHSHDNNHHHHHQHQHHNNSSSSSSPDPTCATGVLSERIGEGHGPCCCAASCGTCGGTSCQDKPGGADKCCCSAIAASGRSCADGGPPCIVQPRSTRNPKRGFVADHATFCDDAKLLNVSGWYYDYNPDDAFQALGCPDPTRFSPMNWCVDDIPIPVPLGVNTTFFMGFNEPNNLHNCNSSPRTIALAWKSLAARHNTSILVSPATAGNGIPWFDAFFANCTALYGPRGCNISMLAAHDYSCTPNSTLSYLESLHTRYGLPIWLTEFSCGDGAQHRSTSEQLGFMSAVLPLLDAAPFVYRYSWMSMRDPHGLRGLLVNNSSALTVLGHLWNS